MNDEYVKKQDAMDRLRRDVMGGLNYKSIIGSLPAADVAPVVHSEWIYHMSYGVCKKCGYEYEWKGTDAKNYCPNCGAKMDGEE